MNQSPAFSEGKRNSLADSRVSVSAETDTGEVHSLTTVPPGGSETVRMPQGQFISNLYVLPSRRFFNPYFGSGSAERVNYVSSQSLPPQRSQAIDAFSQRLYKALEKIEDFNRILQRVLDPVPDWTIELSDQGQHYVRFNTQGNYHNSDGLGEGTVSLLFIVDALYDSQPEDIIVIDEPELSLHPAHQRSLARLFAEYAKDRQIIYATHSPYFLNFYHILNGASVARIHRNGGKSEVSQLSQATAQRCHGLLSDSHNPHILDLNARETFFKEDGVILVEGQEDVVYYPRVFRQLVEAGRLSEEEASAVESRLFGWGAGGADKIEVIAAILSDLGFQNVAGIVDNNRSDLVPKLEERFPNYHFLAIPADDVRTKKEQAPRPATSGLLDEDGRVRPEFANDLGPLFKSVLEATKR